jgi:hypothetical protein
LITNKTATLHWGQATMFAALSLLDHHLTAEADAKRGGSARSEGVPKPPKPLESGSQGKSFQLTRV